MGWPRIQHMATRALFLAAVWRLGGKGRVANRGNTGLYCTRADLSPMGRSIRVDAHCAAVGQHPGSRAWGSVCNMLLLFSFSGRGPKKEKWQHPAFPPVASGAGARSHATCQDGIWQQFQPLHPRTTESRVSTGTVLLPQVGRRKHGWFLRRTAHQKPDSLHSWHKWLRPVQASSGVFSATTCCEVLHGIILRHGRSGFR